MTCTVRPWARWLGTAAGIGAASYAISAGISWRRYGHPSPVSSGKDADSLLDRFMPEYEVVDRHSIRVRAPAEIAMLAAEEMDLRQSAIIHSIFRARELVLGARPGAVIRPQPLVAWMKELGWRVLAEIPGREIVLGAVTQPWKADVV
ncbi:MAG TPA: hypothetical protein VHB50_12245, partial [Bryobacteraceae bacterium]|nr:hypothetical protein [Bryobacteraceae bacterium]